MNVPPLPTWKCHKIVCAAVIVAISASGELTLEHAHTGEYINIQPDNAWLEKHQPRAGGYFVQYEDGYCSYSPKEAFESGYALNVGTGIVKNLEGPEPVSEPIGPATREITSHKVNGLNEALKIEALDEVGEGGACHLYQISGFNSETNRSDPFKSRYGKPADHSTVLFQNGPIANPGGVAFGANGISNESLLAIVADRLECFQDGPYKCRENALALTKIQEAMMWLQRRTNERIRRGVEGTSKV